MGSDISPLARLGILLIRFYQHFVSPLLGQHCRFYPTCSQYTLEAIREWGFFQGCYLGIKRILKCNPLNPGGFDPIPRRAGKTGGNGNKE
ncbi:MAG: membrane protein insertion efficiency factor YidD [Succinatimonas hippei]|nr:membrane protein insertion efficiency factor YidD [Succinatimonas hippei]